MDIVTELAALLVGRVVQDVTLATGAERVARITTDSGSFTVCCGIGIYLEDVRDSNGEWLRLEDVAKAVDAHYDDPNGWCGLAEDGFPEDGEKLPIEQDDDAKTLQIGWRCTMCGVSWKVGLDAVKRSPWARYLGDPDNRMPWIRAALPGSAVRIYRLIDKIECQPPGRSRRRR